jgi:uncharacterized protein YejL (UPF0352 family)
MLRSAPKKQPPPGLESEPRSGSKHADNVALLNYVREELGKLKRDAEDKLAQMMQTGITPAEREALASSFRVEPQSPRSRPDPLKVAIAKAKSARRAAPLLAYLNEQLSGTGIKARIIMPKRVTCGYSRSRIFKRGVPHGVVEIARDILAVMRRHFTPKQRKSWWSVGTMATILWFEGEDRHSPRQ